MVYANLTTKDEERIKNHEELTIDTPSPSLVPPTAASP